jgi:hypothetical protein
LNTGVLARTRAERRNDLGHRRAFDGKRLARLVQARHHAPVLRHPERVLVVDGLAARRIMR